MSVEECHSFFGIHSAQRFWCRVSAKVLGARTPACEEVAIALCARGVAPGKTAATPEKGEPGCKPLPGGVSSAPCQPGTGDTTDRLPCKNI